MDTNRIITIIANQLTLNGMKISERLENSINSQLSIDEKVLQVTELLRELAISELIINKFNELIPKNNIKQNINENG